MPRCPNCGQKTSRTEDWACSLCGYPLLSPSYKKITKTYKQLQAEKSPELKPPLAEPEPEPDPEVEPVPEPELKQIAEPVAEPEPEPDPEVEPVPEPELKQVTEPVAEPESVPEPGIIAEAEPVLKPEPASGAIVITVAQLNSMYNADRSAANTKLVNKALKITGVVEKVVVREHLGIQYMLLASSGNHRQWSVRCTFGEKQGSKLKGLTTGEMATVQGEYDGYERNIILKNCALTN